MLSASRAAEALCQIRQSGKAPPEETTADQDEPHEQRPENGVQQSRKTVLRSRRVCFSEEVTAVSGDWTKQKGLKSERWFGVGSPKRSLATKTRFMVP